MNQSDAIRLIKDDESSPFYRALGLVFGMDQDIWQETDFLQEYHNLKSEALSDFLRSDLPPLEITSPFEGNVITVEGKRYRIVPTNMPYVENVQQGMKAPIKQNAVIDGATEEPIYDPEVIFKVLFTDRVQRRFGDASFRSEEASVFIDAANSLNKVRTYHSWAQGLDFAQDILSKILAQGVTHQPISPDDLVSFGLDASKDKIAALIANFEMGRIESEFRNVATELSSLDFSNLTYEQASAFYVDYANLRSHRGHALLSLAEATFPGNYESEQLGHVLGELWYTIKKVGKDIYDAIDMGNIDEDTNETFKLIREAIYGDDTEVASLDLIKGLLEVFQPILTYHTEGRRHDGYVGEQKAYAEAYYLPELLRNFIDPSKGTNTFASLEGNVVLELPSGASMDSEYLTLNRVTEEEIAELPELREGVLPVLYKIGPEGTVFDPQNPPTITIHYEDSELQGADENKLRIFTYHEDKGLWFPLPGPYERDTLENIISTQIRHLSLFGLGVETAAEGEPVASLVIYPKQPTIQDTVRLSAAESYRANEVRIDFEGDGIFDTPWQTDKDFSHQYVIAGPYNPRLEVRNADGIDSITKQLVVIEKTTAVEEDQNQSPTAYSLSQNFP